MKRTELLLQKSRSVMWTTGLNSKERNKDIKVIRDYKSERKVMVAFHKNIFWKFLKKKTEPIGNSVQKHNRTNIVELREEIKIGLYYKKINKK